MTPRALRPLLLDAATAADDAFGRACTDGDPHQRHRWTDGRRAWTCQGRAGDQHHGQEHRAEVIELSLAG